MAAKISTAASIVRFFTHFTKSTSTVTAKAAAMASPPASKDISPDTPPTESR